MRRTRGEIGLFRFFVVEFFVVGACAGLLPAVVLLGAALDLAVELFAVDFCWEDLAGATCAGVEFSWEPFSGAGDELPGGVVGLSDVADGTWAATVGAVEVGAKGGGVEDGDDCCARAGVAGYAVEPATLTNPHLSASPSTHPIKPQRIKPDRTTFSIFARIRECQNLYCHPEQSALCFAKDPGEPREAS